MKSIINFHCSQEDEFVRWDYNGREILKKFPSNIYAEPFISGNAIVVVILSKSESPNNAIILNPDGSEKIRISNPIKDKGEAFFSDVYLVKNIMNLVLRFSMGQFSCEVNEEGVLSNLRETR